MANKVMYKYDKNSLEIYFVNYAFHLVKQANKQSAPCPASPEPRRLFSAPLPTRVTVYPFSSKIKWLNLPDTQPHRDMLSDLRHCLPERESSPQTLSVALVTDLSADESCSGTCSSPPASVRSRVLHLLFRGPHSTGEIMYSASFLGFVLFLIFLILNNQLMNRANYLISSKM